MLGPFTTASRLTPIHQMSLAVLSHAACASMSTIALATTTTRDRGDRYGHMEWAEKFRALASAIPEIWMGHPKCTRSSAIAEGPREALVSKNPATRKHLT